MMVMLSFLLPDVPINLCSPVSLERSRLTLDRVGLGQLAEVGQELFGNVVPSVAITQTEVDMGAGELVYVELSAQHEY